jgi:hypothetical protein
MCLCRWCSIKFSKGMTHLITRARAHTHARTHAYIHTYTFKSFKLQIYSDRSAKDASNNKTHFLSLLKNCNMRANKLNIVKLNSVNILPPW